MSREEENKTRERKAHVILARKDFVFVVQRKVLIVFVYLVNILIHIT